MKARQIKRGDSIWNEESFLKAVSEGKESLYRIAFTYVKNKDDALEIVQEAVYKAYISYNTLEEPQYFNTWLTRITINCAMDYIRKTKKVVHLESGYKSEISTYDSQKSEEIMDLYEALDKLDEKQKTIIILRFFEDKKIKDIADILKYPVSTVKSILYRALEKLKVDLKEVGEYE